MANYAYVQKGMNTSSFDLANILSRVDISGRFISLDIFWIFVEFNKQLSAQVSELNSCVHNVEAQCRPKLNKFVPDLVENHL